MHNIDFRKRLTDLGLKVTPRRLAILEAIAELNHPTTEEIIRYIRKSNPKIAVATVYKALAIMADRNAVSVVKTGNDSNRYDAVIESHHHLCSSSTGIILDYADEKLSELVRKYLKGKKIEGFSIEDFRLQIIGKFNE